MVLVVGIAARVAAHVTALQKAIEMPPGAKPARAPRTQAASRRRHCLRG
jgi:hypothetical protein